MPEVPVRANLHKRHSYEEQKRRRGAAENALCRIYCDVTRQWRACANRRCKRHRRCCGDAWECAKRGKSGVPASMRERILADVRAGGPARVPPINNFEADMRRDPSRWL